MSTLKDNNNNKSDDEFYDALTETHYSDDSEEKINKDLDDLVHKQTGLHLSDDNNINIEEITENKNTTENNDDDDETLKINKNIEFIDETIDENELREREKELSEADLLSNKESADKLKLDGNEEFRNDNSKRATEIYTEALLLCPTTYTKERAILYGNRAAAKIKLDAKKSAIDDCTKALELWPEYVRALLRRAKLYEETDKLEEALEDFKKVHEFDAGQADAREAIIRLPPVIKERNERLKEEMMGKLKDLGNMILKPFGLSTSNFQMQQDPNTGSYSINFNQKSS